MNLLDTLISRQRKLLVVASAGLTLVGGFAVVVFRPSALEAYRVLAEWTVYLAAFFGGANALAYWAQRPGPPGPGGK